MYIKEGRGVKKGEIIIFLSEGMLIIEKHPEFVVKTLYRDTEKISKELSPWGIENREWEKLLF